MFYLKWWSQQLLFRAFIYLDSNFKPNKIRRLMSPISFMVIELSNFNTPKNFFETEVAIASCRLENNSCLLFPRNVLSKKVMSAACSVFHSYQASLCHFHRTIVVLSPKKTVINKRDYLAFIWSMSHLLDFRYIVHSCFLYYICY